MTRDEIITTVGVVLTMVVLVSLLVLWRSRWRWRSVPQLLLSVSLPTCLSVTMATWAQVGPWRALLLGGFASVPTTGEFWLHRRATSKQTVRPIPQQVKTRVERALKRTVYPLFLALLLLEVAGTIAYTIAGGSSFWFKVIEIVAGVVALLFFAQLTRLSLLIRRARRGATPLSATRVGL